MIRFVDEHRDQFGVEAICRTLGATGCGFMTSRGYRAAKTRPASARALRDDLLLEEIRRVHAQNYSVYGVLKMHHAMARAGWDIGRDQTARLMKRAGLESVRRGRKPITTRPAAASDARPDLVERRFTAQRPNQLWVADITYVRIPTGFCYVAFITDVHSRKIVGVGGLVQPPHRRVAIAGPGARAAEHRRKPGPQGLDPPQRQGLSIRQSGLLRSAHHSRGERLGGHRGRLL